MPHLILGISYKRGDVICELYEKTNCLHFTNFVKNKRIRKNKETRLKYQGFRKDFPNKIVVRCAIWQHLYNFKKVKNTHGGVLILVKLQAKAKQSNNLNPFPQISINSLNPFLVTSLQSLETSKKTRRLSNTFREH